MPQVTLNIPDKKYPFFMELINSLDFIKKDKIKAVSEREEILAGIKQAGEEMRLIKAGKLKARPIQDVLDEI